jgi:hypothetical protein
MIIFVPSTSRLGREGNAFLLMIIAIILFIVCIVASCQEARYSMFGKIQNAAVDKMYKRYYKNDTDDSRTRIQVDYIVDDPECNTPGMATRPGMKGPGKRLETDTVDLVWFQVSAAELLSDDGKSVAVQYLPGSEGSSRLVGHTQRWVYIPVAVVFVLIAILSIRFIRDFNAHQRRMAAQSE